MAHWAQIDKNNLVVRVTVGDNADPSEGYDWLVENLGGTWLKTSYNTVAGQHVNGGTPFRGNFAGIGFTYDEERDAFIPPKPFESWPLDETTFNWVAPIQYPADGAEYEWDEEAGAWTAVE
jgi:hypothetical protein